MRRTNKQTNLLDSIHCSIMEFTYKRAYYSDTGTGTGREKIYTHNNGSGRSLRQRSRFRIRRSQNRSSSGGSRKCYEILMCFRSTLSWWVFLKHSCALRWTLLSERSKPTVAHTQQTHRNERISFSTLIHRVIRCFDRWWVFGVFFLNFSLSIVLAQIHKCMNFRSTFVNRHKWIH